MSINVRPGSSDDKFTVIKTVSFPKYPGFEVLAKETKYVLTAYSFANHTQADRKAAEVGNGFEVYHWGWPWYVARPVPPGN